MPPLVATALAAFAAFAALWLWSLHSRDVSVVDLWWGPGFLWIGVVAQAVSWPPSARGLLVLALVGLWGLRLGIHLFRRNHGQPEDFRYRRMREQHGDRFVWVSLVTVFGLQALLQWVVSLPIQVAVLARDPEGLGVPALVGVGVFALGLTFEAVGDLQLARFRADPAHRGKVLDSGLWAWTRHPNYFGDALVWWGLFGVAAGAPGGPWTVVGPVVMTVLLMRVSGVALLEKSLMRSKPGYREYAERTPAFFPWPPGLQGRRNG